METHALGTAGQLLRSAAAQLHGLAGHDHTLASDAHARTAGAVASLGRFGGGGGFGRALVHLFIWRLIWRAGLGLWRIPTVGPFVVVLLIAVIVTLVILRRQRGPRWWSRRGGSTGAGTGRGPRDW